MRLAMEGLSGMEIQMVHERTMVLLRETGVLFRSRKAFDLLRHAGFRGDQATGRIHFEEKEIMEAVSKAPGEFTLAARNPHFDYALPSMEGRVMMSGICPGIYDLDTKLRRDSVKADVVRVGRIFQHAKTGIAAWTGCSALDMPGRTHCLHEMAAILTGTSKHIQFQLSSPYEAPYAKQILSLLSGSREEFLKKKIASILYCPTSPLTQEEGNLDACMELADFEVPVNIYPMPMIGMTSPATLFSTLVQINAEILSALTLFQTVHPGWPMIYGVASGAADARTGAYVRSGEAPLISLAGTSMARFYKLPCCVTGGGSFETLPALLGGADLLDGIGTCDNGMSVRLELILMEDETARRMLRLMRGIRVDAQRDLLEEMMEEGPGGAFLQHRSTMGFFRDQDELYTSELFPSKLRGTIHEMEESLVIANRKVREILASDDPEALPSGTCKDLDGILRKADGN